MHRRHLENGADRAALLLMSLLAAMVLGGCAAPVSGQASRTPTVDLTPRQMRELADDVLAAHADLRAVTKTVTSREPYTVDKFTAVERAVDGSVHRLVTFEPSTAATLGIDEIRCLGAENFATPIPADLATEGPTGQSWVKTVAEPEDDAAELAFMVAYFCDWGWPTTLDWDLEYLLAARSIVDLGTTLKTASRCVIWWSRCRSPMRDRSWVWLGGRRRVPDDDVDFVQVEIRRVRLISCAG